MLIRNARARCTPVRVHVFLLAALCAASIGACGDKKPDAIDGDPGAVKVGFGDTAQRNVPMGPDDVRITSIDGVLVLSLIGDTVRMQLSDSLRNSVANEVNKDVSKEGGAIGSLIAKSVGAVVSGAMGFVVRASANDVEDLRVEDGHIRFNVRNSKVNVKSSGDNRSDNAKFSDGDARKFIDAVHKRQNM